MKKEFAPLLVVALFACGGMEPGAGDDLTEDLAAPTTGCQDSSAARICYWLGEPAYGKPDFTVRDGAVALIDGAPAGSTVRLTAFRWEDDALADALVRATGRGVRVRLLFNGGTPKCGAPGATPAMAKICATSAALHFCSHDGSESCLGQNILHAKVMTLSATGGRSDVVWVGSHNWNTGSGTGVSNNAVAIEGDKALYDGFQKWLDDMTAQASAPQAGGYRDVYHRLDPKLAGSVATAFFSPSGTVDNAWNGDFVAYETSNLIDLGRKPCSLSVMPGDGWTNGRADVADSGHGLEDTVVRYRKSGCDVRVLAADSETIESTVLSLLAKNKVPKRHHAKDAALGRAGTHDKLILVKGFGADGKARNYVFLGSHNLQFPALRKNDEAMLRLSGKTAVFNAYAAHFNRAWNAGTPY